MEKGKLAASVVLGALIASMIPLDLLATTAGRFDAGTVKEISEHASTIQGFIFGAPMRIAGVLGIGYGGVQSFLTGSPSPLYGYGGVGLASMVLPSFIKVVFPEVSGMLLP